MNYCIDKNLDKTNTIIMQTIYDLKDDIENCAL